MDLRVKDKVLVLALIGSLWIHITGFLVLKVKILEVTSPDRFLEVGLLESRQDEPLVDLPRELEGEEDMFGPLGQIFLKSENSRMEDEVKTPDLLRSGFLDALAVNIDSTQKEKNG